MTDEEYRVMDEVVARVCQELQDASKKNNGVVELQWFNMKDESHMAIFYIAAFMKYILDYKLKICCRWIDYFKMKKLFRKKVDFKKGNELNINGFDCHTVTYYIEIHYHKGILEEIYREYYKR